MARDPGPGHIGGDIGALIIHTGPELAETEIEISLRDDPHARRGPNVVHARHDHPQRGLPRPHCGTYTVWRQTDTPAGTVVITGGAVTVRLADPALGT